MTTKRQYVEYLICTNGNYTSSNPAEHLEDVSYAVISDHLIDEQESHARGDVQLRAAR